MKRILPSILATALCLAVPSCTKRNRLSEWEKQVSRPNFRLLDSIQTADYLIAVYETGKDEIAFCYNWVGPGTKQTTHSLSIRDDQGNDLHDHERKQETDLTRKRSFGVPKFLEYRDDSVDGIVYPARPGYHGPLSIVFRDGTGQTSPNRIVYERKIPSR